MQFLDACKVPDRARAFDHLSVFGIASARHSRDYSLLVSHNRVPSEPRSLFACQLEQIDLPIDTNLWPA
jgi:hypothetical protein